MKKIICFMAVFLVLGQLTEIKQQTINYGECIQQWALIDLTSMYGGTIAVQKCSDCNAYITVKDKVGDIKINNRVMTQTEIGHFCYIPKLTELQPNILYSVYINVSSSNISLGSDIVDSTVFIRGVNTNSPNINNENTIIKNDLMDYIKNGLNDEPYFTDEICVSNSYISVLDVDYLLCSIQQIFIKPVYNILVDAYLIQTFKIVASIIYGLLSIIPFFFGLVMLLLSNFILFANDPTVYLNTVFIPYMIGIFMSIFIGLFLLIFLVEFIILLFSYVKANGILFDGLGNFFTLNYKMVFMIFGIGYAGILGFIEVVKGILYLLKIWS